MVTFSFTKFSGNINSWSPRLRLDVGREGLDKLSFWSLYDSLILADMVEAWTCIYIYIDVKLEPQVVLVFFFCDELDLSSI